MKIENMKHIKINVMKTKKMRRKLKKVKKTYRIIRQLDKCWENEENCILIDNRL